tara:strand:+ start:560 stop:838 length:279 start_codon:yes stop_codon:yes gene_type:complete
MGILDAWVTSLSYSDVNVIIATAMLYAALLLVLALMVVGSHLGDARMVNRTLYKNNAKLAAELISLKEMLVTTKFLTLNPEVFADEHKESSS